MNIGSQHSSLRNTHKKLSTNEDSSLCLCLLIHQHNVQSFPWNESLRMRMKHEKECLWIVAKKQKKANFNNYLPTHVSPKRNLPTHVCLESYGSPKQSQLVWSCGWSGLGLYFQPLPFILVIFVSFFFFDESLSLYQTIAKLKSMSVSSGIAIILLSLVAVDMEFLVVEFMG